MQWHSASSDARELSGALEASSATLCARLGGAKADLVLVFASDAHRAGFRALLDGIRLRFPGARVVGCSAESVIGGGREIEERPGLSLLAASLPGVHVHSFRIPEHDVQQAVAALREELPFDAPPAFVLLGDPFGLDAEGLVDAFDAAWPGAPKIGGLASGGRAPGETALFLDGERHQGGAVGLALAGEVVLDTLVAQGCRPIGNPLFVTRCRDGFLLEVDGRPPLETLQAIFEAAPPEDRTLMRSALFLGIEMSAGQHAYGQGDFLIRNLVGMDADSGALAVAAPLSEAQVVQFHVRDARASSADLEERFDRYRNAAAGARAARGVLLFSCLGRGQGLYGRPDHDSDVLRRHLGDVPVGGFFCNGEIGPVQGRTFLHGYTSAFGILRPRP